MLKAGRARTSTGAGAPEAGYRLSTSLASAMSPSESTLDQEPEPRLNQGAWNDEIP